MSARWLAVGSVVASLGGLLAVSWLIYAKQEHQAYFQWPGILGIAATAVGFAGLLVGVLLPDHGGSPGQVQRGGDNSRNFQVGGDIIIRGEAKRDVE